MKINNLKKIEYISIVLLIVVLISNVFVVYASQKSDLQNEQSSIDKQIEETNSEISGVKSQMSDALTQINQYNSEIGTYENEIGDLESQISTLQKQITEKRAPTQSGRGLFFFLLFRKQWTWLAGQRKPFNQAGSLL